MAHSNQARKRSRQALARNTHNREVKSDFRTRVKEFLRTIQSGDRTKAETQVREIEGRVDKAAKRRIIHPNTASRIKSRLKGKVSSMGKAAATSGTTSA